MFNNMHFEYPGYFYLLLILPLLIGWYIYKAREAEATLRISSIAPFQADSGTYKRILRHVMFGFRCLVIALLITVLARPQSASSWQDVTTEGIDIVLALDISSSMLAEDFKPNRLEASKEVAGEFINGRPDDRIGLVVFSGESFTQCPLTTDHDVLVNLFKDLKSGMIEDGTAIGLGLANAVNRLKDSKAKSKVIILLTDGVNNMGEIAPVTAAEIAKTFDIRVYTIGVGTLGKAPYPFQTPFGIQYDNIDVEIDEGILKEVSSLTDGKYFRATDNKKLREIYKEIDAMEKSKIEVREYSKKKEEFLFFALLAGFLLLAEIIIRNTLLRTIP